MKGLGRRNSQRKPQVGRPGDIKQLSVFKLLQDFGAVKSTSFMRGSWKDLKLETEAGVKAVPQRPWSLNFILKVMGNQLRF